MNVRSSKDPGVPTNSANLLQKRVSPQCSTAQGPKNDGFKAQQLCGNSQGLAKKHTTSYYYDIPSISCKFIYSFTFQDSLLCLYNIIIQLRAFISYKWLSMGFSFRKFRKWGTQVTYHCYFGPFFWTIFLPRFGPWCIQLPTGPGNKIMSQVAAGHHSAGHLDTVPGDLRDVPTWCCLDVSETWKHMKTYENIWKPLELNGDPSLRLCLRLCQLSGIELAAWMVLSLGQMSTAHQSSIHSRDSEPINRPIQCTNNTNNNNHSLITA